MIIWLPHLHIKTENLLENELLTKVSGRTICVLYKLNVKSKYGTTLLNILDLNSLLSEKNLGDMKHASLKYTSNLHIYIY